MNESNRDNLVCARYEFQNGKRMFDAYKNFCRVLGNDAMSYKDFDFWWNRFANGKFDLDYNRSQDPPTLELSEMPIDIMEKIIKKLEWKERLSLRCVSKACRQTVYRLPYTFNEVKLSYNFDNVEMKLDNQIVLYRLEKVEKRNGASVYDRKKTWKCALQGFVRVFKNPKFQIKTLLFKVESYGASDMDEDILNSLDRQLHVENLNFKSFCRHESSGIALLQFSLAIIPHLKPGVLEDLVFELPPTLQDERQSIQFDEIIKLEQWKYAKSFRANCKLANVDPKCLSHFHVFWAFFDIIDADDVVHLKNLFMNSSDFEWCNLRGAVDEELVLEKLKSELFVNSFGQMIIGPLLVEISSDSICFDKYPI